MRPIIPLAAATMRGVTPATVGDDLPQLTWVNPHEIFVENEYQRDLSEHSIRMIRNIVAGWRWFKIKPVICAEVGGKLMALDGQHTAIAAATLGVKKIPAMIVIANTLKERAEAFIGQNRDRLNLTAAHLHFAAVAAGDEIAVAVDQACRKAGVTILRWPKGATPYKVGETMTVGLIHKLVKRYGVNFAARVLRILVDAKRAPLMSPEIAAVAILLREPPFQGKIDTFDLVTALRANRLEHWLERAESKIAKGAKRRNALAEVLFEHVSKRAAA